MLARAVHGLGRSAGRHLYDGHVNGDREARRSQIAAEAERVATLQEQLRDEGIVGDVLAGGSYIFDLWPPIACVMSRRGVGPIPALSTTSNWTIWSGIRPPSC